MHAGRSKLILVSCALLAGTLGFSFQSMRDRSGSAYAASDPAGIEDYLTTRSFSEVANTRALLEALALRTLHELRLRRISAHVNSTDPDLVVDREQRTAQLIAGYQEAIREFSGTGLEFLFVQDLLGLYKRGAQHQEWISLFLEYAYRNPTQESIGRLAHDAMTIARATCREPEVLNALRHLRDIPFEFTSKSLVRSLASAEDDLLLADSSPTTGHQESRE